MMLRVQGNEGATGVVLSGERVDGGSLAAAAV